MMYRLIGCTLLGAGVVLLTSPVGMSQTPPSATDAAKAKKALQEIQDFIGLWNLEGTQKVGAKTEAWKESVSWGWKFKDGAAWLIVSFADGNGKYFTTGDLRYDVAKKKYVLTLTPAEKDATPQQFVGDYSRGMLKLERTDAKTGDVYRITMNTAAEGIRFVFRYEKQTGGKGLFNTVFAMNGNKDGESLAGGGPKKPECVVSGGAANIAVQYNGKTYYVCCSGCRDEFLANPQKYAK